MKADITPSNPSIQHPMRKFYGLAVAGSAAAVTFAETHPQVFNVVKILGMHARHSALGH